MPRITPIHYRKLAKVFEKKGFVYVRTKGDHLVYEKKGIIRPVIIPKYKQIPEFIILRNLKTANITREEYIRLLRK
jgi:predicted RNA binding protein YcfA (HicA-like mRNA interferase family)